MQNLNLAKRVMRNGNEVMCEVMKFDDSQKVFYMRVTNIRRMASVYYGQSLASGIWWPIVAITSINGVPK